MRKIIITILILTLWFTPFNNVMAVNTHTTVLDRGTSQYWSIVDAGHPSLDITGDTTIEFWVNFDTLPSTDDLQQDFFTKFTGSGTMAYRTYIIKDGVENIVGVDWSGDGSYSTRATQRVNSDFIANTGVWVHIAFVIDVSVPVAIIYKNGSVVASTKTQNNPSSIFNSAAPLTIGNSGQVAHNVDGMMDEVRLWDDIRTPEEILDNYNCSLVGDEDNLVSYWRFDNDGDDSGLAPENNNDLTNNNSATFQSGDLPFTDTCGAAVRRIFMIQ